MSTALPLFVQMCSMSYSFTSHLSRICVNLPFFSLPSALFLSFFICFLFFHTRQNSQLESTDDLNLQLQIERHAVQFKLVQTSVIKVFNDISFFTFTSFPVKMNFILTLPNIQSLSEWVSGNGKLGFELW